MKKIVFGFDHEGSLKKVRESPSRWPTKVEDAKLFSVPLSQARHSLGLSLSLSCPFFDLNFAISGSDTAVLSIREDCVDLRGARERERERAEEESLFQKESTKDRAVRLFQWKRQRAKLKLGALPPNSPLKTPSFSHQNHTNRSESPLSRSSCGNAGRRTTKTLCFRPSIRCSSTTVECRATPGDSLLSEGRKLRSNASD